MVKIWMVVSMFMASIAMAEPAEATGVGGAAAWVEWTAECYYGGNSWYDWYDYGTYNWDWCSGG